MSEFSRMIDARHLPQGELAYTATEAERAELAKRFLLVRIDRFESTVTLIAEGESIRAKGRISADLVQSCAVSGDDLPARINEPFALRFVPEGADLSAEEEIELTAEELDEIVMDDTQFDLGEALAQTLALAIDPYAVGPNAEKARREAGLLGEGESGPFAALKGLLKE